MKNTLRLSLLSLLSISLIPAAYAMETITSQTATSTNPEVISLVAKVAALQLDPTNTALLLVDPQFDFVENGSLQVPNSGIDYQETTCAVTKELKKTYTVRISRDFHPENHMSFHTNNPGAAVFTTVKKTIKMANGEDKEIDQVVWPKHCVQGTHGAQFFGDLETLADDVTEKGTDANVDSYSAFKDGSEKETGLDAKLKAAGTINLLVAGIATDVCVEWTVNDAVAKGYKVYLLKSLCRGVYADKSEEAIARMAEKGVTIVE
jgi:nicotinamidase/pyrazinamidase